MSNWLDYLASAINFVASIIVLIATSKANKKGTTQSPDKDKE